MYVDSDIASHVIPPTAANSYIRYLLYYGYDNEMSLDIANQTTIAVEFERIESSTNRGRTNYSRKLPVTKPQTNTVPLDANSKY